MQNLFEVSPHRISKSILTPSFLPTLSSRALILFVCLTDKNACCCCAAPQVVSLLEERIETTAQVQSLWSSTMAVSHYQSNTIADEVDLQLIHRLLLYICEEGMYRREEGRQEEAAIPMGAVLVFMPGWDEIIRMKVRLEKDVFGRGR